MRRRVCVLKWIPFYLDESAQEISENGVKAAESGDMGRALNLLSHAVVLNDKDYKSLEMIAQVKYSI